MSDLEKKIEAVVRPFVAQLTKVVTDHVVGSIVHSIGTGAAPKAAPAAKAAKPAKAPGKRGPGRPPKAKPAAAAPAAAPAAGGSGSLGERLVAHLTANPGQRMDQLSKALAAPVPKIQAQIAKLLESGSARREGQRRGMKYFLNG